jgi:putative ABC transport system permease protein
VIRIALSALLAQRRRLFATSLAITIGVALMAGTLVLNDTITRTFDDLFGEVNRNTDAVVRAVSAFEGPDQSGAQRPRLPASLVATVARVPGVRTAEGEVFGYARLIDKQGHAIGSPNQGAPTIGLNWPTVADFNPFVLTAGRAPTGPTDVVIDAHSAKEAGFHVGDPITVLVNGPPLHATVVGITRFGTADSPGGASVAAFATSVAQRLIGEPTRFDAISLAAAAGVTQTELAQRVRAMLPSGMEAVTGAAVVKENQNSVHKAMGFFTTFMEVFAGIALFVGAFIIVNTFSITVAQRAREHALLRALGASRRQVLTAVLVEGTLVGLLASVVGLAAGVGVAEGLKALLGAVGIDVPAGAVVFRPRTAVISLVVGVGVAAAATFTPARRAARVAPVAVLHGGGTVESGAVSGRRAVLGSALVAAGMAALLTGLSVSVPHRITWVGVGALAVFLGVSTLAARLVGPFSRWMGQPLRRFWGVSGELAQQNAMRNPRRTASTASALMIGVALVAFVTVFVASSKASVTRAVDRSFHGDLILDTGAAAGTGVDPALATRVAALPQVAAASGIRLGVVQVSGRPLQIAALDPATGFQLIDVDVQAGSATNLGAGAIAVQADEAASGGLHLGDPVSVVFRDTGKQTLRVAMIYREKQPFGPYLLGQPAYDANFATHFDWQVYVKKAPGVSAAALSAAVQPIVAAYPGVDSLTLRSFESRMLAPLNQLLALVYALLGLAVLVALIGIANTLSLSTVERRHEIGLLRAVGMSRRQLRRTIRLEAGLIAMQGTVLGLATGVLLGWAFVRSLHDEGVTVLRVPAGQMLVIAVIAGLAGVLAATGPGRRAARLDVMRALAAT